MSRGTICDRLRRMTSNWRTSCAVARALCYRLVGGALVFGSFSSTIAFVCSVKRLAARRRRRKQLLRETNSPLLSIRVFTLRHLVVDLVSKNLLFGNKTCSRLPKSFPTPLPMRPCPRRLTPAERNEEVDPHAVAPKSNTTLQYHLLAFLDVSCRLIQRRQSPKKSVSTSYCTVYCNSPPTTMLSQ
jgi:hypothetical protein